MYTRSTLPAFYSRCLIFLICTQVLGIDQKLTVIYGQGSLVHNNCDLILNTLAWRKIALIVAIIFRKPLLYLGIFFFFLRRITILNTYYRFFFLIYTIKTFMLKRYDNIKEVNFVLFLWRRRAAIICKTSNVVKSKYSCPYRQISCKWYV